MPVTLAQASLNAASAIDRQIIDEFRKSSFLLDRLPFVQSVNPDGGGSTLVYGYTRQITQRAAAFRAINAEYTPTEVTKAQYTTELRPLGGSFQIDRVLTGIGAISEVTFQLAQLIKATKAYFADQVINGDTGVTPDGFDGLSVALTGSATEIAGPQLDFTAIDTQAEALTAVQRINAWLALMDGPPDVLLMNGTAKSWFSLVAAFSGQLRSAQDAFGRAVETFRDIPLVDLGEKAGTAAPRDPELRRGQRGPAHRPRQRHGRHVHADLQRPDDGRARLRRDGRGHRHRAEPPVERRLGRRDGERWRDWHQPRRPHLRRPLRRRQPAAHHGRHVEHRRCGARHRRHDHDPGRHGRRRADRHLRGPLRAWTASTAWPSPGS